MIYKRKKSISIQGAGGGKKPPVPKLLPPNSKDAKRSTQTLEVIDLICEGPIAGIVDEDGNVVEGEHLGKGIYLNGTPIRDSQSNAFNFRRFLAEYKQGFANQSSWSEDSFNYVSQTINVQHKLIGSWSWGEDGKTAFNQNTSSRDYRTGKGSSSRQFGTWRGLIDIDDFPSDGAAIPGEEWVHTISNTYVNKATINVRIDSLRDTVAVGAGRGKSGDLGSLVSTTVKVRYQAGYYSEAGTRAGAFFTKFEEYTALITNPYGISLDIDFGSNGEGKKKWIAVQKVSYESLSPLVKRDLSVAKVVETISTPSFLYPSSAMVATRYDARTFQQLPQRTFDCKLKIIRIPSNYYPENRGTLNNTNPVYNGIWDGTFKWGWTDNPAWILYDLIVNNTYGIGDFVDPDLVDIWTLYQISRYADAVDEGGLFVGVNRNEEDQTGDVRFSCNIIIGQAREAFGFVSQIAAIFRGITYWINGGLMFSDDRPKPTLMRFNNSDIKGGSFSYSETAKNTRFTVAEVQYNDRDDEFNPKIESVEDAEGLAKSGPIIKRIEGLGVTNKAEANRLGKYILYTSKLDTETVTFITGQEAMYLLPGDVFSVSDEIRVLKRRYGKILGIGESSSVPGFKGILVDSEIEGDLKTIAFSAPQDYKAFTELKDFDFEGSEQSQDEIISSLRSIQSAEYYIEKVEEGGICTLELDADSKSLVFLSPQSLSIHEVTLNKCGNDMQLVFDPPIYRVLEGGEVVGFGDDEDITNKLLRDTINTRFAENYGIFMGGSSVDTSDFFIDYEDLVHPWGYTDSGTFIEDKTGIVAIEFGLVAKDAESIYVQEADYSISFKDLEKRFIQGDYSFSIKTKDLIDAEQEYFYRTMGTREITKNEFEVIGLTYSPEKFDAIEGGEYVKQKDFNYGDITSFNLQIFKPATPTSTLYEINVVPTAPENSSFDHVIEWEIPEPIDDIERFDVEIVYPDGGIVQFSKLSTAFDSNDEVDGVVIYKYSINHSDLSADNTYSYGFFKSIVKAVSKGPYFTPSSLSTLTFDLAAPESTFSYNSFVISSFLATSKISPATYVYDEDYMIGGSGESDLSSSDLFLRWNLLDPPGSLINVDSLLSNSAYEPSQTISILDSGKNFTASLSGIPINNLSATFSYDQLTGALGESGVRDYYAQLNVDSTFGSLNPYVSTLHLTNPKPNVTGVTVSDINPPNNITGQVILDISVEPYQDLKELIVFSGDNPAFSPDLTNYSNVISRILTSATDTSKKVYLDEHDGHSTGNASGQYKIPYNSGVYTGDFYLPSGYLFYKVLPVDSVGHGDVFSVPDSGILLVDPDNYGDNADTATAEDLDLVATGLAVHTSDLNNPHQVTAAQLGAASTGDFAAHTGDFANPHQVTVDQLTLGSGDDVEFGGITANGGVYVNSATSSGNGLEVLNGVKDTPVVSDNADTIAVYGAGRAYYKGRDVTNNIEFIMGTSTAGVVFLGSMTNHSLDFRTNNTNRMYINSANGRVGINTKTPSAYLGVVGDANISTDLTVGGDLNVTGGVAKGSSTSFSLHTSGGNNIFRGLAFWTNYWDDSVNSAYFQVGGSSDTVIFSAQSGTAFKRVGFAISNSSDRGFLISTTTSSAPAPRGYFEVRQSGTTNLLVERTTGNVGVQTSTPATELDVAGEVATHGLQKKVNALGSISGATAIDLTNGSHVTATLTAAITPTFSGSPVSGYYKEFTLSFSGVYAITWAVGTKFAGGIAPVIIGTDYEISCGIDDAGVVTVYGVIDSIST